MWPLYAKNDLYVTHTRQVQSNMPPRKKSFTDSWIDVQSLALQSHDPAFNAPSREELARVEVSDIVKICNGRERFFVEVTKILKTKDKIYGVVSNELVCGSEYNAGDTVTFERRHIYSIQNDERHFEALMTIIPIILKMKSEGYSEEDIYAHIADANTTLVPAGTNVTA